MATIEQLSTALANADKAGDTEAARVLANEIIRLRSEPTATDEAGAKETPSPAGRHLTYEEGLAELEKEKQDGGTGQAGAAGASFLEGFPIVGPALLGTAQRGAAALSAGLGTGDYESNLEDARRITTAAQEANPKTALAGNVAGAIAPLAGVGATAIGARALGMTGPSLMARAGASVASGSAISGADTLARGGDVFDAGANALIGGGISGAIPIAGAGLSVALKAIGNKVYPTINAIKNPAGEANRRVGMALTRDFEAAPTSVLNQADEATARANNISVLNADRGGETTRALARSVANQSPEAREIIGKTADDRFGAQSQRASEFVRKLANGNADDLAYQERVRETARMVNRPAYARANQAPEAQQLFTKGLQELMQSPSIRKAVGKVPARSADRGAVEGFKEIANPFERNSTGAFVLRRKADGTFVAPTLQFWDMVKRNLDSEIGRAVRAGDNSMSADLNALKGKLVNELDQAVPAYKVARQGAAGFFGAEDALEAGRKFATTPRAVPEAKAAFGKFTASEKDAFATGYASELIDRIKASGDRSNVINSVFKNQSARESMELVFGPRKMREIEAYVRVEDLVDRLRGAMGNSTTARQLVELGIGAGGGAYMAGDLSGAVPGALAVAGARHLGQRIDNKVMIQVANLLTKDNPGALKLAVQQAAAQPAYMAALEKMGAALAAPARAGALVGSQ